MENEHTVVVMVVMSHLLMFLLFYFNCCGDGSADKCMQKLRN